MSLLTILRLLVVHQKTTLNTISVSLAMIIEAVILYGWVEIANAIVRHVQVWKFFLINSVIIFDFSTFTRTPIDPVPFEVALTEHLDLLMAHEAKHQWRDLWDDWQVRCQKEEDQVVKSINSVATVDELHEWRKNELDCIE